MRFFRLDLNPIFIPTDLLIDLGAKTAFFGSLEPLQGLDVVYGLYVAIKI